MMDDREHTDRHGLTRTNTGRRGQRSDGWLPNGKDERCARIWLKVTDVRAERLQEITDDGARQEGVENREAFRELWGKINGEASWDNNPYVWVIKFERVKR